MKTLIKIMVFPIELVIVALLMFLSAIVDFFRWLFTNEPDEEDDGSDPNGLNIVPVKRPKPATTAGGEGDGSGI